MDTITDQHADIGHNNPPSAIDAALEITAQATAWVAASPEILDADMAKEASDLVAKLRAAKANLAAALKTDLAPHDEAIAGVKALYKAPSDQVQALGAQLLSMSTTWIQKERARIAAEKAAQEAEARRLREEAERLERERMEEKRRANEAALQADAESRAEAEAARQESERAAAEAQKVARDAERAAAKKVAPVVIKSEDSKRSIRMQVTWSAVVTDEAAAIESYRDHPEVRAATLAAALKVATAVARATKSESGAPAGFRFVKDERAI